MVVLHPDQVIVLVVFNDGLAIAPIDFAVVRPSLLLPLDRIPVRGDCHGLLWVPPSGARPDPLLEEGRLSIEGRPTFDDNRSHC